ncbi:MAG: quinolinate synthase NadA [Oscillospiraceae bacterium]|nr:quinolinate synthase NadA [Oscillospiraceae bacterium]
MTVREIQDEIIRLKQAQDICLLAHSYQSREIVEVADITGDSFQLSLAAKEAKQKTVVMCGVKFMAETVKILSPEKRVILAHPEAGCPMAEQMDKDLISGIKAKYPHHTIVAYINTTAGLKTICDVCVTSSSAVHIIKKIPNDNILFLPDRNLGAYVAAKLPDKSIHLLPGGCPIHAAVAAYDVHKARAAHPGALLLVHPECTPEVTALADFTGSTSAIMDYAVNSQHSEFIIGTEISIAWHLQYRCPGKRFYYLSKEMICPNMRITTLIDLLDCVKGIGGLEIDLDENTIKQARVCIDKMIELGAP